MQSPPPALTAEMSVMVAGTAAARAAQLQQELANPEMVLSMIELQQNPEATQEMLSASNEWLRLFGKTYPAWSISIGLLAHPKVETQFFAASVIYNKILESWSIRAGEPGAVSDADRMQLLHQLLRVLREQAARGFTHHLQHTVASKLAESLATMALSIKTCASELISTLVASAKTTSGGLLAPEAYVLLAILGAMVEELAEQTADLDHEADEQTEHAQKQLRDHAPTIRALAGHYLREVVATRTTAPPLLIRLTSFIFTILSCPELQGDMSVLYECGIWEPLCQLFLLLLTPMEDDPDPAMLLDAATSVFAVAQITDADAHRRRWPSRDAACELLLAMLLAASVPYQKLVTLAATQRFEQDEAADDTDQLCQALARVMGIFGESEVEYLAADRSGLIAAMPSSSSAPSSPPANPNASYQAYFSFLLLMTRHPYDRMIIKETLDVWWKLHSLVKAPQRAHLRPDIFTEVAQGVINCIAYPVGFQSWLPEATMRAVRDPASDHFEAVYLNDPDEFTRVREQLCEWVELLVKSLGCREVVRMLSEQLFRSGATWQQQEACTIVLLVAADELKIFFDDEHSVDQAARADVLAMLDRVAAFLWTLAPPLNSSSSSTSAATNTHPLLLAAACGYFESYAFRYELETNAATNAHMLERTISFLVACIPRTQTSSSSWLKVNMRWLQDPDGMVPKDGCNLAGHTFRALCTANPIVRDAFIQNQQLLQASVRMVLHTPGFSEHILPAMRKLWLRGFGALACALAHSPEVDAILTPGCPAVAQSGAVLSEIASGSVIGLQRVFGELAAAYQQKPKFQPNSTQQKQISRSVNEHLYAILAILKSLAYSSSLRPSLTAVTTRILECEKIAEANKQPMPVPPPSFAYPMFEAVQPLLEQVSKLYLRKGGDQKALDGVVSTLDAFIALLYPHELARILMRSMQLALQIYTFFPLPSVLRLFERAVIRCGFGGRPNLREMWAAQIGQLFNLTITHSRSKSATPELDDRFFILCGALYEYAPVPFILNSSNTLAQIFQFSVKALEPSNSSWCRQCVLFLRLLLTNTDPLTALPDDVRSTVRVAFRDCYKLHGESILRRLAGNLESHEADIRPGDESLLALNDILSASLERYPIMTTKWTKAGLVSEQLRARIQRAAMRHGGGHHTHHQEDDSIIEEGDESTEMDG